MPIVKVVKDDLLEMFREGQFDDIVHGCNCFHNMGAGIARQIADEFPEALEADKETKHSDPKKLGTYSVAEVHMSCGSGSIVNMYTQWTPGRVHKKQDLYDAIRECFRKLNKEMEEYAGEWRVGVPLIGAGLAGGDWNIIKEIINDETPNLLVTIVEFKKRK